jgi:hypothetical protein
MVILWKSNGDMAIKGEANQQKLGISGGSWDYHGIILGYNGDISSSVG